MFALAVDANIRSENLVILILNKLGLKDTPHQAILSIPFLSSLNQRWIYSLKELNQRG